MKLTLADEERSPLVTPTGISGPKNAFVSHECPRDASAGIR